MSEQLAQVLPLRKRCNTCKLEKPVTEFYRLGNGYQAKCKTCKAEYEHNKQASRKANPPLVASETTCCVCGHTKPANEFYKSRVASNGLQGSCKPCQKAAKKQGTEESRKHQVREQERRCDKCKLVTPT